MFGDFFCTLRLSICSTNKNHMTWGLGKCTGHRPSLITKSSNTSLVVAMESLLCAVLPSPVEIKHTVFLPMLTLVRTCSKSK
jgi:hypothetical protein